MGGDEASKGAAKRWDVAGCTRLLLKDGDRGCSMADSHFSTAFPSGCEGESGRAWAGVPRSESQVTLSTGHTRPPDENALESQEGLSAVADFPS